VKHTLSLMQLVSICSTHTAPMEALVEKHHGLSLTLVSRFLPPDKTDGGSKAGGEESHLLERLPR